MRKPPKYESEVRKINDRNNGDYAVLLEKRDLENYLHNAAIQDEYRDYVDFTITFTDIDSVPELLAARVHELSGAQKPWADLEPDKKAKKISQAKKRLNDGAAKKMTLDMLIERDPGSFIEKWLKIIAERIQH